MKYKNIVSGKFIDRPNRFIAHVEIEGKTETVHVKNTGRCKELLVPGATVIMEDFRFSPAGCNRKTKFDLVAVYKKIGDRQMLINMDSQAPNKVTNEWLLGQSLKMIKPEYSFGSSRIDFYFEKLTNGSLEKWLLEIKGCTLERDGLGYFPDAPTERGIKHLKELTNGCKLGYKCAVGFVIQMEGIEKVLANTETHPEFGIALEEAKKNGVEVWFLLTKVTENSLKITKLIKSD